MFVHAQPQENPGNPHSFWLRLVPRLLGVIVLLAAGLLLFASPATPALAIDTPTLVSPANALTTDAANYPPLGIPTFAWNPVATATVYHLQASQDIGFATIPVDITTQQTTYTPTSAGVFTDGQWYWRVRVEAPTVGTYSAARTFTKQWASAGNLPSLTSPADGATFEYYDQTRFVWTPVTGAANYDLQVATSMGGFGTPLYEQLTLAFDLQPAAKFANGTYFWRVVPRDLYGRSGTPSVIRSFNQSYVEVPSLLTPPDNDTPTFTPTFSWTAQRGAEYYRLQYSTDPSFNTAVTQVDSRNTEYTPNVPLPNDVNYYWRMRTYSTLSLSDWSAVRTFVKRWYIQPELLTPPNNYQYTSQPFFSWSPVPSAHSYRIEVGTNNSFPPNGFTDVAVNTYYVFPTYPWGDGQIWYWRVTPIDSSGNYGKPSNVSSFVAQSSTTIVPRQIAPLYYYSPTVIYSPTIGLTPHEDRSIAYPLFSWHRIISPTSYSELTPHTSQIQAYRIQVNTNPLFLTSNWTFDTENMYAAPSATNPFTPTQNGVYYWRVHALDAVGGNLVGQWSEVWKTRFDSAYALTPTGGAAPTLLSPFYGSEWVETLPLFAWQPLSGADSYSIDVSGDPNFGSTLISATVTNPQFAAVNRLPFGTYYWRVHARSGGSPIGSYSPLWRFQIASQSRWRPFRVPGDPANKNPIGTDPAGDMSDANYDLTTLNAVQDKDYWYFGFNATGSSDVVYGLYLDLDHVDGSGGPNDPYDGATLRVATIPAHRPEYALYVVRSGGVLTTSQVYLYHWTGINWSVVQTLDGVGGLLSYNSGSHYVEIRVPNTAIGMQDTTNSAAVSLFSAPFAGGHAQDSVPSDPNVAYGSPDLGVSTTTLSRFTSVSERLNTAIPPNNVAGDPTQFAEVAPFAWQQPVDVPAWYGYELEVHKDPQYTSLVIDNILASSYLVPPDYIYNPGDLQGDNTYYWRVRPAYLYTGAVTYGAWGDPTAFDRQGFVPQNLTISVSFATPTFHWSMTEGTDYYNIQVDDDPNFGSLLLGDSTARNRYTPVTTFDNGTYYWRVRATRINGVANDWSPSQVFTLTIPAPQLITVTGPVARAPAICWTPVVTPTGVPVFAAWRYFVQLSRNDPTFSAIFDSVITEQSCWTPTHGLDDDTYYWRVAVEDGQARLGEFANKVGTQPALFSKEYLTTTLLSPLGSAISGGTPTFSWTPVYGAASYHLQTSTVRQFTPLTEDVVTHNTHYTPPVSYTPNLYYWRVAIIDLDGKQGHYEPNDGEVLTIVPPGIRLLLPMIHR